jgi:hypothetical protein
MEKAEVRPLALDFVGRGRAWAGAALLAVALLLAADAGAWFHRLGAEIADTQARLERVVGEAAAARKATPQEVAFAQDTVRRLSLPWLDLLAAMESAATEDVALLGVDPDSAAGTVLINGEARDYPAALEYLRALSRNEALSDVQLVRHEQKGAAVSFAISAGWLGRRLQAQQ